jgi:hypothetical protein
MDVLVKTCEGITKRLEWNVSNPRERRERVGSGHVLGDHAGYGDKVDWPDVEVAEALPEEAGGDGFAVVHC